MAEVLILDGKKAAKKLTSSYQSLISTFQKKPSLHFILIGDNEASQTYVKAKEDLSQKMGILTHTHKWSNSISFLELKEEITKLNNDPNIHGILLQLPIPPHLPTNEVINLINPKKDVDGLTQHNMGLLIQHHQEAIIPCTPRGILELLTFYAISLEGKIVAILGRSLIVGKPLALLILQKQGTPIILHSKSPHEAFETLLPQADILIVAVGKEKFLHSKAWIKKGAIVIDVGIHRKITANKSILSGDVDIKAILGQISAYSPVPGGVGPMTVACVIYNLIQCYKMQENLPSSL